MYAIAIDIDSAAMEAARIDAGDGLDAIAALLASGGFEDQGGSVFFGGAAAGPVEAVLAVRRLGAEIPWLQDALRGVRLLRVAETTDLRAAFDAGAAS